MDQSLTSHRQMPPLQPPLDSLAIVFDGPEALSVRRLALIEPKASDAVVEIDWSGISTGTERLLWSGQMPPFPGLGYPLVPGYESAGTVIAAGPEADLAVGTQVFVPGAQCFEEVRGLFGGAARRIVVPAARLVPVPGGLDQTDHAPEQAVLLALAGTAQHALAGGPLPDLIVGHGVLGRLLARLTVAAGGAPTVWETNPIRMDGATGYEVVNPQADSRTAYKSICDCSGDSGLLNMLISRLAPGGEIVLAGFYAQPLSFDFAPAFMREARIRIAAEWKAPDMEAVADLLRRKALSLDGLITHRFPVDRAAAAYETAFSDPACLKMILDWRSQV